MFDLIFGILAALLCRILRDRLRSGWQVWQIKRWCQANHWTEFFIHDEQFFAFPPHAVIPLPIPLDTIKRTTKHVKIWKNIQSGLMFFIPFILLGSLLVIVLEMIITLSFLLIKILQDCL